MKEQGKGCLPEYRLKLLQDLENPKTRLATAKKILDKILIKESE